MPLIPDRINEKIQWFEQRITSWKAAPATIGLTAAQATALDTIIKAGRWHRSAPSPCHRSLS